MVVAGGLPPGPIVTEPPFLCIEILSPSDRLTEMQDRIGDYLSFGVRYVWLIDPTTRHAWIYTSESIREVRDGVLTTEGPDIRIVLSELE
jgi:Uma2 family endonuclease